MKGRCRVALRIIILLICVLAVTMTFRGEWLIKTFTKDKEPSAKKIMSVKCAALFFAVAAFAAVFTMM